MKQFETFGNSQAAHAPALPFVMDGAETAAHPADIDGLLGHYDEVTQTWVGRVRIGAGSYSSRSNGSRGGYSYQSDD